MAKAAAKKRAVRPAPAVTDYRVTWNMVRNAGKIAIKVQGSGKGIDLEVNDPTEFLAVLALLQGEKTVFFKPPFLDTKP
ncbi:MAG: hypothetical protein ACTSV1_00200 [Alphaproteobacteria bacterium]